MCTYLHSLVFNAGRALEEKGTTWEACLETEEESVCFTFSKTISPWKHAMTGSSYSCLHEGLILTAELALTPGAL